MFRSLSRSLSRKIRQSWFGITGWLYFRRSNQEKGLDGAHRAFRRLLSMDRRSFSAHLYLGRIARARHQESLALEHLVTAYRLDPQRFRRSPLDTDLKYDVALREGLKGTLESTWDRLDEVNWVLPHHGKQNPLLPTSTEKDAIHHVVNHEENRHETTSKPAEIRGPITKEEIASTDLDELIRRLTDGF